MPHFLAATRFICLEHMRFSRKISKFAVFSFFREQWFRSLNLGLAFLISYSQYILEQRKVGLFFFTTSKGLHSNRKKKKGQNRKRNKYKNKIWERTNQHKQSTTKLQALRLATGTDGTEDHPREDGCWNQNYWQKEGDKSCES